ncbi:Arginine deiminase [Sulfidibacter corallicola]|uniref:arginine deiminase n=1 Tax=Sulfidibacter corallicola TaxID=2818388 RepID=A0A8A4TFT6_SULCO|nr:arginine deiminase family protein [Sulfidibacter corallicola]QTD48052.1 hypothetical protein J3U87_20910 [Sulfidibacter corallicola]
MTQLSVYSEIGRLRAVAVHSPGLEVDRMTPSLMHELLFDDILFGKEAREEHDVFSKVIAKVADDVYDVQEMLATSLGQEGARRHFLDRFCVLHQLQSADRDRLEALDDRTLAELSVAGWYEDIDQGTRYRFRFPPVPNLLFMRDPAAVIGNGVSLNHMATNARRAEPFILDTVMRFHPKYRIDDESRIWFDAIPGYLSGLPELNNTIEGGDILVLSQDILAIGVSIRTTQSAVTMLAEKLRAQEKFKTLFAVLMPHERAVMHLDTIFTQIDREHCLVFPPFFCKGIDSLPVIKMDLSGPKLEITLKDNFLSALADEGHALKPILCGGKNRLDQEREQWTDGANAFCLAPGVILGYSRNLKTANELEKVGYNVVSGEEVLAKDIDLLDGKRYLVMISGNELSRARGGARCMTFPLRRDPI